MISLKVTAMDSDGYQMGRFSLVVELHWRGCATDGATPSGFKCTPQWLAVLVKFFLSLPQFSEFSPLVAPLEVLTERKNGRQLQEGRLWLE